MNNIKVIVSCNDDPYYFDFWEIFSKIWKNFIGITPVLIHFGEKVPCEKYGEVHTIKTDENIPINTQCQMARLWFPQFEPNVYWITSDIDMLPLSKRKWIDIIQQNMSYSWVNLNSTGKYFPICYNMSLGKNYETYLETKSQLSEFIKTAMENFGQTSVHRPENHGTSFSNWNLDEYYSSLKLSQRTDDQIIQKKIIDKRNRVDRINWNYNVRKLKNQKYVDCHCLRPYKKFKTEIDRLLEIIL